VSSTYTVQQAVALLGYARVQALVMAVATANYMRAGQHAEAIRKCWRHSMASAILSRELARACRMPPDFAYSFGLLHDIGRLGLLVAYPAEYSRILQVADRDEVSLLDQEKLLFGIDHREAGRHHDPPDGGPVDSLLIGYLGCQMADTLGYSVVEPLRPTPIEELLAPFARRGARAIPGRLRNSRRDRQQGIGRG